MNPNSDRSQVTADTFNSDPEVTYKPDPKYPARALDRDLEGDVEVEYTIGVDGSVQDIKIINSSSHLFEDSAIEAMQLRKYKPQIRNGIPTERVARTIIHFKIKH